MKKIILSLIFSNTMFLSHSNEITDINTNDLSSIENFLKLEKEKEYLNNVYSINEGKLKLEKTLILKNCADIQFANAKNIMNKTNKEIYNYYSIKETDINNISLPNNNKIYNLLLTSYNEYYQISVNLNNCSKNPNNVSYPKNIIRNDYFIKQLNKSILCLNHYTFKSIEDDDNIEKIINLIRNQFYDANNLNVDEYINYIKFTHLSYYNNMANNFIYKACLNILNN